MKYYFALLFVIALIYGITMSMRNYYYSSFILVYWLSSLALISLFLYIRLYVKQIQVHQYLPLVIISLIYFISWHIIPFSWSFGIFPFATVCFLYSGVLLYNLNLIRVRLVVILAVILSCFNVLAVLYLIAERTYLTRPLINAFIVSNVQESTEYLFGKFTILHFIILSLFFMSLFFLFIYKRKNNVSGAKFSVPLGMLFILSFFLSSYSGPVGAFSSEFVIYLYNQNKLKKMVEDRKNDLKGVNFSIVEQKDKADKIVIIIGESLNRQFMSLYGNKENTSPNLIQLEKDSTHGKLYAFDNVISSEIFTVQSLRKVLTNINNTNNIPFEKCVTWVDLFKKAGYESFWISNQAPMGTYDTPNAVISSSADHAFFTGSNNNVKSKHAVSGNYFDEDLLNIFSNYISKNKENKKQIYFIHLQGSHYHYDDRYPDNFKVFKVEKRGDRNSYLNTVLYNDWVVSNLIKIGYQNGVDVMCYFSDHGEDLVYQHNIENYQPCMVTVPFLFYLSKNYIGKHPELANSLLKNLNTPGMTDNLFQDIQFVTGVKSSLFNPRESFLSDEYIRKQRKVVDNSINYDK